MKFGLVVATYILCPNNVWLISNFCSASADFHDLQLTNCTGHVSIAY